jgi:hypothetical protein
MTDRCDRSLFRCIVLLLLVVGVQASPSRGVQKRGATTTRSQGPAQKEPAGQGAKRSRFELRMSGTKCGSLVRGGTKFAGMDRERKQNPCPYEGALP